SIIADGIVNDGSIKGTAGICICVSDNTLSGGIVNNATGSIIGLGAAGIAVGGPNTIISGGIANRGWIGGGENGFGILLDNATYSGGIHNFAGGLLNEGRIDATGGGDGIQVNTSNFLGTLNNAGLITSGNIGIHINGFI